eukprot:3186008-Amphidinium_carterae.1
MAGGLGLANQLRVRRDGWRVAHSAHGGPKQNIFKLVPLLTQPARLEGGEQLEVLHVGCGTDDGWLYAKRCFPQGTDAITGWVWDLVVKPFVQDAAPEARAATGEKADARQGLQQNALHATKLVAGCSMAGAVPQKSAVILAFGLENTEDVHAQLLPLNYVIFRCGSCGCRSGLGLAELCTFL